MKFLLGIILLPLLLSSCTSPDRPEIGVLPYGDVNLRLADTITTAINKVYGIHVGTMDRTVLPAAAFVNIKTPRYRADKILALLTDFKPDTLICILALTDKDISITKRDASGQIKEPRSKYEDFGIFGLANSPGDAAVVSTYRLKHKDQAMFINRLKKVAVHEIGHTLGLPHCESASCVMADAAESIRTIDQARLELCDRCRASL
jgi:archaemetzincin